MAGTEASCGPLILIGAGRSGTTLFKRVIDAHPGINFQGETDFLAYRLWREIYENRFWFEWRKSVDKNPHDAFFVLSQLAASEQSDLQKHCGTAVAGVFKAVLNIGSRSVSGFKEIWNGSESFNVPWEPYDFIFPHAHWVHLVRHPMSFSLSCARWMRDRPDEDYLRQRLSDWVGIVKKSRMRRDTGRFHEIRYEDLTRDIRATLTPILGTLGLKWHSACELEVQRSTFETSKEIRFDAFFTVERFATQVPELVELCTEFDYSTTESYPFPLVADKKFASRYDLRSGFIVDYIPLREFEPREGFAWFTSLPQLSHLADSAESPNHSSVTVMEDSCMMGPSHALHELIRREGKGAFSHWMDGIYLSTSDGSDPNLNGRSYFALAPRHPAQGAIAMTNQQLRPVKALHSKSAVPKFDVADRSDALG
jgi:hypothetical protein